MGNGKNIKKIRMLKIRGTINPFWSPQAMLRPKNLKNQGETSGCHISPI